ncbi:MAG: hypothetical protein KIT34_15905 [Cyanobacteria bacterium TGS_CYA1]|nr:hypothetical protein [Cyanobacteria bacterium TGS_CYA1]
MKRKSSLFSTLALSFGLMAVLSSALSPAISAPAKAPEKEAHSDAKKKDDVKGKGKDAAKSEKSDDKKAEAKTPAVEHPVIANVVDVTPLQLVDKPTEYLGKNVKFTANFFAYCNLALNYKPAMRPQKDNISFLVLRPDSKVPLSELKIAMPMPKNEKDPKSKLLSSLHDGDKIEITANVFSTQLDEPWIDVLDLKKLSPDKPKDAEDDDDTL